MPPRSSAGATRRVAPTAHVIIAAALAGFVAGATASWLLLSLRGRAVPPAVAAEGVRGGPASFAPVVRAVSPSVVNIDTTVLQRVSPLGGTLFSELFGRDPFEEVIPGEGTASGVIIRSDGYILTNQHVVENAQRIAVTLADQRQFKARVVGADRTSDLAVLHIDAKGLQAAALGDSAAVEPGDWVVVIGNPFGFQNTVTVGVVSAVGRPIDVREDRRHYEGLIQTDAYINRGNSGGPLVDENGHVIGIATAIVTAAEAAPIGFAIPINAAKHVKDALIAHGRVSRSWIGVSFAPAAITPELAQQYGLPASRGVIVAGAIEASPAARAGLRRYDIVTQIGDTPVANPDQALQVIATAPVGSRLNLRIWRPTRDRWEQHVVAIVTIEAPLPSGA